MGSQKNCCTSRAMTVVATFIVVSLLFCSHGAQAATISVGYTSGWTFNMQNWPNGKRFKSGDTLVFNYSPLFHNVAVVDSDGYNSCTASPSSETYTTGKDRIGLTKGTNYFICTRPFHCYFGMKIAVEAA